MYKPQTKRELWAFIGAHFGVWLPYQTFSPGNSNPFDFVADGFFRPDANLAAWASRSGIKTLGASILAAMEYRFNDNIQGRVLSGSEDQAKFLYTYWAEWCAGLLRDRLEGDVNQHETKIAGGKFQILAASQKKVRGPKVQRLYRDERDEMDSAIIEASIGMLATREGVQARTVDMSTWHKPHGEMGKLVEQCPDNGITLHRWNFWESLGQCPEDRHEFGLGCKTCLLGSRCLAKAQEVKRNIADKRLDCTLDLCKKHKVGLAADCRGLFTVSDALNVFAQAGAATWDAEYECLRPSLDGMVYSDFDRAVHVMPDLDFSDDLPIWRAVDFGLNNFICLWIQEDKLGNVYVVDEYWGQNTIVAECGKDIADQDRDATIEATFVDPAGRNKNDQTGRSSVEILSSRIHQRCEYSLSPRAREVSNGVGLIRTALKPAVGTPRLYMAGSCKQTIKAMESYRLKKINGEFVDEPVKPQPCDHWVDALRYFYVNRKMPGGVKSGIAKHTG